MIYIVFGLSGPLKRLLTDPIVKNYGETEAKKMINEKATVREKEAYDTIEIVVKSRNEIKKNYDKRYQYNLRKNTLCAVNIEQIKESISSGTNHFVICHDFKVIKNIIQDCGKKNVIVFNVSLNDQYEFVKFCEERYNNNPVKKSPIDERVKRRLRKLVRSLNPQLIEGNLGIEPDEIRLIYPKGQNKEEIANVLWEKLKTVLNPDPKKYDWRLLLSSDRLSGAPDECVGDDVIPFQNDYDRIVSSSPFRRLQDKAQVFPLEKYDHVRTRLTHSIECATVAEKIGILAEVKIQEKLKPNYNKVVQLKAIPIILKSAALIHDIGNPPFGHFGEDVIRDWVENKLPRLGINKNNGRVKGVDEETISSVMNIIGGESSKFYKDLLHYDGNAQGLRIMTRLCIFVDKKGYDLTYATLGVILKYPTSSSDVDPDNYAEIEKSKIGYFSSEKDIYCAIQKELGLKVGKRHPLTYLLEAADDISYLSSDLQDAHKKGLVSLSVIRKEVSDLTWLDELSDKEKERYQICKETANNTKKLILNEIKKCEEEFKELKSFKINYETYIVEKLHHFIKNELIRRAVEAFKTNYDKIMEAEFQKELLSGDKIASFIELFIRKRILKQFVYNDISIVKTAVKATTILNLLLDTFAKACIEKALYEKKRINAKKDVKLEPFEKTNVASSRIYSLLSENYRVIFEREIIGNDGKIKEDQEIVYLAMLLALDNICGMTDSYAESMYKMILACD